MTGHVCPECGRQDDADGRPGGVRGCGCGRGTAPEGFDPLRVRPYVALPDPADAPAATASGPPPELTQVLAPATHGAAGQDGAPDAPYGAAGQEGPYDHRHEHGPAYDMTGVDPEGTAGRRRRGRGRDGRRVAVAVAAVVAVLGTAAYASGLLTKDGGGDDRALPDSETTAPFVSAAPDAPDASVSASESATRSTSPSESASSPESAPASTSRPAGAGTSSPAPLTGGPTPPSATPTSGTALSSPAPGVTLRRGDDGPEVVELQERLRQVGLYGRRSHGRYDGRVEDAVAAYQDANGIRDDPEGVYGPATRRALEAETRYPYDDGNGGWDSDGRG
ncbi:peptidoglycan-binding domain-containing protein [Streptomyces marianii]|uniref:Peptidoglycan-binding protein n=1 Tax=Streptomyces marianii TaxID=1817406 RepID=A0A5R9EBU1_9ACTN|nr:peptidoglycan-binding domain-containing protein [Streptomyces marianii]TLQ46242.1 peptidoglycan-binding protein [Streptomyces marianii]